MNLPQGLVVAATIFAGAIAIAGTANSSAGAERYLLAAQGDGAWRLDTITGEMIWCRRIITDYRARKGADSVTTLRGRNTGVEVECYGRGGEITNKGY